MYFRVSVFALFASKSVEATVNACKPEDKALFAGNQEFADRISDFAVKSFGMASGTVEKLTKAYPALTVGCAECFGEAVACGTKNCFLKCAISANSPACVACSTEHCRPRLMACVGTHNESELPPAPGDRPSDNAAPKKTRERKLGQTEADDDDDLFDFVEIVFGPGGEFQLALPVQDEDEETLSLYNHPSDLDGEETVAV